MKGLKNWLTLINRSSGCATLLFLLAGTLVQGNALAYTLSDGNSVVQINASSLAGMAGYWVDGVNQVKQQWFYYRIGNNGPESSIENISLGTPTQASQSDSRTLDLTYGSSLYSARVVYTLTGGASGSGRSSLSQSITFLNNSSTSTLDLRFFDYSDFDLTGIAGGQSLQFGTTAVPTLRTNKFTQTMGSSSATTSLASSSSFASGVEAALFNQTLLSLTDANPTTLNGVMGPVAGDVTGTFEWAVTLPANGSLTISKVISLQVPEPSAFALLGLALLVWTRTARSRT